FKDKDGKHGPETKKHRFEVVDGKDQLPETKLTQLAKQYVVELEGADTLVASWHLPVNDTEGNVVFRLSVEGRPERWRIGVVHIGLTPRGKRLGGHRFEHLTCVAYDSAIETPGGKVPVQALSVGDAVFAFDTMSQQKVVSRVRSIRAAVAPRLWKVGELLTTGEHPIHRNESWAKAAQIGEPVVERAWVFDIEVAPPHTFFANGEVVHNKAMANPRGGHGDLWAGVFHREPKPPVPRPEIPSNVRQSR